jgi:16S rRNA processing protein RimM
LEFVTIGQVLTSWGIKGQIRVKPETDFPQRYAPGARVYIDQQPFVIEAVQYHGGKLVIKLVAVDRAEDAQKLRGKAIEIPRSEVPPLPEGQYYYFQLVGLEVWIEQGERLGNIAEILPTESNDVYIVRGQKGEVLIPAIEDVVQKIDLPRGRMVIRPIAGLLG